jgi:hypothetical protein
MLLKLKVITVLKKQNQVPEIENFIKPYRAYQ